MSFSRVLFLPLVTLLLALAGCSKSASDRAAQHMKSGADFAARKQYRKAAIEFKVASQNLPSDAEPHYQLARVYLEVGAGALAIESLQKALRLNPNHESAQFELASIQVSSGNDETVAEARQTLLQYVQRHPKHAEAAGLLALAEAKLNRKEEARKLLGKAIQLNPADLRPAGMLVARYTAKGDLAEASSIAKALNQQLPQSPDAALLSAQVSAASKDLAAAESHLRRALTLNPNHGPALEMMVRKKLVERDLAGAEDAARSLSKLPEKKWWTIYGRILFGEQKFDLGIAEFQRVLAEHGGDVDVRNEFSALLHASGRRAEAENAVKATLAAYPGDAGALLQRLALAVDRGDLVSAANDAKTLRAMNVPSAALSYQESRIFAARGQAPAQGEALAEALKLNPQMLRARLDLSQVLVASGQPSNALALLDDASAVDKSSADFAFHRNAALLAAGDFKEARKGVDEALAARRLPGFLFQDAVLKVRNKDLAGARKSLEEARLKAPADTTALQLLGGVMHGQGDGAAFLAIVRDAAAKQPQSAPLQMLLGNELVLGQRDRKAARAAFEAARAAGDLRNADPAIALLDMDEGAFEPAKIRLTELIKTHDTPQARLLLGQIEARSSADLAVQHYLQALKLDPSNIQVLNNLANLLADTGKLDDARLWADKALARAANDPVVLDTAGWIYFRQSRYPQALEFLRTSLRLRDRPVAHYHLAAALLKTGSPEEARREFETGVRQDPKSPDRAIVAPLFPSSK